MRVTLALAGLTALLPSALGVTEWGQCGGQSYTGSTTCDSGLTCIYFDAWYSQCQKGTNNVSSSAPTTSSSPNTGTCSGATKFKYFGVNESSAEFGSGKYPGVLGTDYTWPSPSSVDYFVGKGMNFFRIAFAMERISPSGLTGSFDATYLSGLKTIVSYVTSKGAYAALDPHNYLRFNGAVITDTSAFTTWWKNLANEFKSDSHVIFDLNNEPWGISGTDAASLMQAGINGVRSSGASQLILVEGTSWSGAWSWISAGNGDVFKSLNDPMGNTAIEMHQYLDSDGSGTSETCVSSTIGVERLTAATNWLKENNLKGFLGEIGGGSNDVCIAAIKGALCYLQQQGGTWIGTSPMFGSLYVVGCANVSKLSPSFPRLTFTGAAWWAAGPWWGTYFQSIEPPSGAAISRILPEALLPFV
ncbi:hypothetical protein FRC14_004759 [Serendipita sp. 396]|nr:hypothetical protein FRC14_004759 [Serendipita sp. 396]KAG8789360.1 hypothetical protein FRC15_009412 [Serendipita sp. 397]KAG8804593.1 hypothetical protein FRC16_006035 [Serendipita sp. 398]KAG8878714.1 hypothetical protein FRC20_006391 [Serendipita sp. 405]